MSSASSNEEVAEAAKEVLESTDRGDINEGRICQLVRERTSSDISLPDLQALIHSVVEEFLGHDRLAETPEGRGEPREDREEREGDKEEQIREGECEASSASSEPQDLSKDLNSRKRRAEDPEAVSPDKEPGPPTGRTESTRQPAKKLPQRDSAEKTVCKLSNKRRVGAGDCKGAGLPVELWASLSTHRREVDVAIEQAQH